MKTTALKKKMKEKSQQFQTNDVSPSWEIPIYTLCTWCWLFFSGNNVIDTNIMSKLQGCP